MSLDDLQSAVHDQPVRRPVQARSRWTFESVCISIVVHCVAAVVFCLLVLLARDPVADRAELELARGQQAITPTVRMLSPSELAELESLPSPTDPPPVTRVDPVESDAPALTGPPPLLGAASVETTPVVELEATGPPVIDSQSLAPAAPPVDLTPPEPNRLATKPMPRQTPTAPVDAPAAKRGIESGVELNDLPEPRYPTLAVRKGQEGVVVLEVQVLPDGTVGEIRVLRDPGFPLLVGAAIDAVQDATFTPAMIDGEPVASRVTLQPIVFRIDER